MARPGKPADKRLVRALSTDVADALEDYRCVGLFGPRRVGKSTLARQVAEPWGEGAVILDLGDPRAQAALADDETFFARHGDKLIVLDEVQRAPKFLEVVRRRVETEIHDQEGDTRFLILGSSSVELHRQCVEALGSRLESKFVDPLQILDLAPPPTPSLSATAVFAGEATATEELVASDPVFDPARLWLRGGFPLSYFAASDDKSYDWRRTYLAACAAREAPGTPPGSLSWALQELVADPGGQRIVRTRPAEFEACVQHLVRLGLVRRLPPWAGSEVKRLAKRPKHYIRDTGLLHAMRFCPTHEALALTPDLIGPSWESFCVEQLIVAAGDRVKPLYYRREEGEEIDLVLEFPGRRRWACEIKHNPDPRPSAGFHTACGVIKAERKVLVSRALESGPPRAGVEILCLRDAVLAVLQA